MKIGHLTKIPKLHLKVVQSSPQPQAPRPLGLPTSSTFIPTSTPAGTTVVQELAAARFFLEHQNLESPVRINFELERTPGQRLPEQEIKQFAERFVVDYSDKGAWWEIVNNGLVAALLDRFPQLHGVTAVFEVGASDQIPLVRASVVSQRRGEALQERFEFLASRLQLAGRPGRVYDLRAQIDYQPGILKSEYPDYRNVLDFCEAFLNREVKGPEDDLTAALLRLNAAVPESFGALKGIAIQLVPLRD